MYSLYHKLIFKISAFFTKLEKQIRSTEQTNDANYLSSLSPRDEIEDKDYLKTLKWAIDEDGVTNIALSGPYGSGKSSIVKAFEKEYSHIDKYNFLNISLATFKEKDLSFGKVKGLTTDALDTEKIEKSILQQIFYSVHGEDIPNSRFGRIKSIKYKGFKTILLAIWIISILELFAPFTLVYYFTAPLAIDLTNYFIGIFATGLIVLLYYFIKSAGTIKLEKLNLKAPEIDFSSDKNNISKLNEHMDEIIYFFEVTKYNILVIEDLDRYENPEIFIKLREINTLLNNTKQISNNKKIVFIYAIRDNMFINKERTKFFDFIMPVVPIINFSNSYTQLKKKFEGAGILADIEDSFLKEISLYIDDMRFLQNVFNEYIQYKPKVGQKINLDQTKLFAMIIYKNWKPLDFAELHIKKGIIYKAFEKNNLHNKINKIIEDMSAKAESLKKEIEPIENEKFESIEVLKSFYITEIIKKLPNFARFHVSGSQVSLDSVLTNDEIFLNLRKEPTLKYINSNNQWGDNSKQIPFKEIEKIINPSFSYDKRVELINDKSNNKVRLLKEQIAQIENEIKKIKSFTIKELIDKYPKESILDKKILKDDVLSYLIRYGYIDEYYEKYISYFYDGDETIEDNNFLLNLKKDNPPLEFDLKLSKIGQLSKRFREEDYSKKGILNYSLLNYLFRTNKENNKTHIARFIDALYLNEEKYDFILGYIREYKNSAKNLIMICSERSESFWDDITLSLSQEQKDGLLIVLFEVLRPDDFIALNKKKTLSEYINNTSGNIFCGFKLDYQNVLIKLDIKFESVLNVITFDIKLLDIVYRYNLYKINNENITTLLYAFKVINEKNGISDLSHNFLIEEKDLEELREADKHTLLGEEFFNSNYKALKDSKLTKLIKYINDYLPVYIDEVYLKLNSNSESLENLLFFIEHEKLSDKQKIEILKKSDIVIKDLVSIKMQQYYWIPIKTNKLEHKWSNLLEAFTFFNEQRINDTLVEYLTQETICQTISNSELVNNADISIPKFAQLLEKINLPFNNYKILMECIKKHVNIYKTINFNQSNNNEEERIGYLINNGLVELNCDNINEILPYSFDLAIELFSSDKSKLVETFAQCSKNDKLFKRILKIINLTNKDKADIINYYMSSDSGIDINNLIKFVYQEILDYTELINKDVYSRLITAGELSLEEKVELFCRYKDLDLELVDKTIASLGRKYRNLNSIIGGSDSFIIENNIDKLIKKLKALNYISSYDIDTSKNVIKVNYNRSRKPLNL